MAKTARKSKAKTIRTRKAGKRGSATKRKTAAARRTTAARRGKSAVAKKPTRGRASAIKRKRAAPKRTVARKPMAETPAAAPAATPAGSRRSVIRKQARAVSGSHWVGRWGRCRGAPCVGEGCLRARKGRQDNGRIREASRAFAEPSRGGERSVGIGNCSGCDFLHGNASGD
jgi:hypothetical protein